MSDHTRIARFPSQPEGRPQSSIGTVVFGMSPPPAVTGTARATYLAQHRVIRSACIEEHRTGVFVFAARVGGGLIGRLWLASTAEPRAATLGRHEAVDLPLAPDAALSLRHLLFIVRTVKTRVRFTAIDLETPAGVHTRHGAEHLVESDRPCLLRTAGLLLFCVPTGPASSIPIDPLSAWEVIEQPPTAPVPALFQELLKRPGATVGQLTLLHQGQGRPLPLSIDQPMLQRGVLIGRMDRCDVIVPDKTASRVHAMVVSIDGVPHLVNAGSSNGTWHSSKVPVKCWKLVDGDTFWIGDSSVTWRMG
jgi:hypothetical protein